MEAKRFLIRTLVISAAIIISFAGINYYMDIYGLFRPKEDRALKVYVNERTSKYLLSYEYIPENFEGILIGPSLSANLNTKTLKDYKIYNASIMGANISELRYLVDNIVERGNLRFAIICLDPYLTKDHGKKSAMIDPKEYYGALGSTNLLKTYLFRFIREYEVMPNRFPKDVINDYGFNNFNLEMKEKNPKAKILEKVKTNAAETTYIDPIAEKELNETVAYLRANGIKVFAYFSPIPYQILSINRENYSAYQQRISKIFNHQDILIDLNQEIFKPITSDYNTYIDHGHLSEIGQKFVLEKLNQSLKEHIQPQNIKYSGR